MIAERDPIPRGVQALFALRFLTAAAVIMQVTMVGKQVFDMTGSELHLGFISLAEFLPTALLAPFVGSVADRYDRRKVLAAGLAGEILAALLLSGYAMTDPDAVWPIYVFVLTFGGARALVAPPFRALPFDLSSASIVERVAAANSFWGQVGRFLGAVAGGFLYVVSPAAPFLVTAGCLSVGLMMLRLVPSSPRKMLKTSGGIRSTLVDAREGLRFVRHSPVLFGAISLDLFAVLFGGAVALLPAIAEDRLGVGAIGLGWLQAFVGLGAAGVSWFLVKVPLKRHAGTALFAAVGVFGVATIVLGLTRSYLVASLALVVLGGSDAISMFVRTAVVPLATPEDMRGRVMATENVFIGASNELGGFESGVTAALLGVAGAVVAGGVATLVTVGLWWVMFPALRSIDRLGEVRPSAPDRAGGRDPVLDREG